jgi:6-phosphofructokinase 2
MVLDASGPALQEGLKEGVHLIKPNLRELAELMGARLADRASRIAVCRELVGAGKAEFVALTLGEEGALLVGADRVLTAPALAVEATSTVGAGDAFVGALVWALAAGRELADAFRCAVAAASATLISEHGDLCRPEDVRRFIGEVRVEEAAA